jgi:hypothetical protein
MLWPWRIGFRGRFHSRLETEMNDAIELNKLLNICDWYEVFKEQFTRVTSKLGIIRELYEDGKL